MGSVQAGEISPFIVSWTDARHSLRYGGHPLLGEVKRMPIPDELRDVAMTYECPACQKPIVKKGSWFKTIGNFRCGSCHVSLRIGYPDKLALFQKHRKFA
jgi:hypothetical protein